MPELTLQEYTREIEGMLERNAYDEAIIHCHHILQQHPKYVESYRLIGQAAFDRDDHKLATDMFTRILSASPSDFVSRAGLAVVFDKQGSLKDAVWQMERAFEIEPGNAAIQEELRNLYARRDGVVPDKVPLTRGALARLYMNGELYSEAAAELRALLAAEPDRVDLQVLLTEALWRDEQRLEASEVALKVLDQMPYCLDANLILGEIWMSGGREEDAEVHLKRAMALDPEGRRAAELFGKTSPIPLRPVEVERLEYIAPTAAPAVEEAPEWLSGVGAPAEAGEVTEVPAWLQGIGLPAAGEEVAELAEPGVQPPVAEEVPSWLSGLGVTAPPPTAAVPAPEIEEEAPEWLAQLREAAPAEAAPAAEEAAIPEWLKTIQPEAEQPAPAVEEAAEAEPDWLAQLRAEAAPVPGAEVEATLEAAEVPDWLKRVEPQVAEQPEAQVAEQEPEWLAQLHAKVGPLPGLEEEAMPEAALPTPEMAMPAPEPAELPEWLRAMKPEGVEEAQVPEWLAAMPTETVAGPAEAAPVAPVAEEAPMPSPEEALAFFQRLTAGKEAELAAQAEAEAEARVAEITGRKPAPEVAPPPPPAKVSPPPPAVEVPAPVTPPAPEAPMPSPEEALAFFQRLTTGKEAELAAQAQAEAEARVAEIIGRKPAPGAVTPPVPPTVGQPPIEAVEEAPAPAIPEGPPEWLVTPAAMEAEAAEPVQEIPSGWEALMQPPVETWPAEVAPPTVEPQAAVSISAGWPEPEVTLPVPEIKIGTGPLGAARQPVAVTTGPDWWYQTLEDEEGPAEEEVPVPTAEAIPAAGAVPLAEVIPVEAAPEVKPAAARVEPQPAPAARAPKRLVRKPPPTAPPRPAVDLDTIMARLRLNPDDPQALLDLARGYRQLGDTNAARGGYDELIRRGAALNDVISDLETVIEEHPDDVDSTRLLGDAHMKAGNLPKALKLYRQALKKL